MRVNVVALRQVFTEILQRPTTQPVEVEVNAAIEKIDAGTLTDSDLRRVEQALSFSHTTEHFS